MTLCLGYVAPPVNMQRETDPGNPQTTLSILRARTHALTACDLLCASTGGDQVAGKQVLAAMLDGNEASATEVAETLGVVQISDDTALEVVCRDVIAAHPTELAEYHATQNPKFIKFFVGQTMRASKGSANPKKLQPLLVKLLLAESTQQL
jgi:Glu-tRNA(Gln) amidotransferase subunit E-like FAD-binding protein